LYEVHDVDPAWTSIPYGYPLRHQSWWVLDDRLELRPPGVAGELYIGGAGLALGYWDDAEKSAERFITHPSTGERLYRTGDLGRYAADGCIEFLGRRDTQVKIHGFRVELGEIEAALAAHPGVHEVVVDAVGDRASKRLVAYVVPHGALPPEAELARHLEQVLPPYMVPSAFVALERLPLSANGKVDRAALPRAPSAAAEATQHVAPSTDVERALAEIWQGVLGVERVGIDDGFFAVGGDSIRSIQVRGRALDRGISFTVQELFQNPTIRRLAAVAKVSARPERAGAAAPAPFSLVSDADRARMPPGVTDAYPLSKLQFGFVFHSEASADYSVYLQSFHVRAPFDVDALRRVLAGMVRRHALLRTQYDLASFEEPLQLVFEDAEVPIVVEDLREVPPAEQTTRIAAFRDAEKRRKFDWTKRPFLRVHVHRRSEATFQFTLVEPLFDGWAVHSLIAELFSKYLAAIAGEPAPEEPPPAFSYAEFVALERAAMRSADMRAWWIRRLEDAPMLELPRADGAVARAAPQSKHHVLTIPGHVAAGMKVIAERTGTSLKSVCMAAHYKALSVLGAQDDVVSGVLFTGRPDERDAEKAIGVFHNAVPLRLSTRGGSFADLAVRAFDAERDVLPHRRFPVSEIQAALGGRKLFDVLFIFTHFHLYRDLVERHLEGMLEHAGNDQTYYALTAQFDVDVGATGMRIDFYYRDAFVSDAQMQEISAVYASVMEAFVREPAAPHARTCLLPDAVREAVTELAAGPVREWDDGRFVPELIEHAARRTPNAVAVTFEGAQLTYAELLRRADDLAAELQRLGVGPDATVGVLMPRSLELVVALCAVMRAGGAYVPIDPQYPADRVSFIARDARLRALLVLGDEARGVAPADVRCIDVAARRASGRPAERRRRGDELAYVIYTSGSTGRPKGAMNTHAGLANRLRWMQDAYRIGPEDVVLQKTPFTFDVSVWEFFWPLLVGARIAMAKPGGHLDNAYLAELFVRERVTVLHFVPSLLRVFLDELPGDAALALRHVICSGEALSRELADRALARLPGAMHNLYGPTEASIDVTATDCERGDTRPMTIGRPIANTTVHVLDGDMHPVPLGAVGELYLGGIALARGYTGRPDLTAAAFVPDPFGGAGARLYRTGDLVRTLRDGSLDYIGRADAQLKLRGVRIELGEIESVLARQPGVRDCAVLAVKTSEDVRLVAYVVRAAGGDDEALRRGLLRACRDALPAAMVPSDVVALDAFPLNANGKLDRRALQAVLPQSGVTAFEPPRSPLEAELCELWREVLGVARVGVNDDFFALGGHSLKATQLLARV
ncbi:MAG TPA: amino acid adenylation domain-containing protein, partial [Minicystis sp.]|nr:amino acid adenylation domain-containing protein [Minicystis sp.]